MSSRKKRGNESDGELTDSDLEDQRRRVSNGSDRERPQRSKDKERNRDDDGSRSRGKSRSKRSDAEEMRTGE